MHATTMARRPDMHSRITTTTTATTTLQIERSGRNYGGGPVMAWVGRSAYDQGARLGFLQEQ